MILHYCIILLYAFTMRCGETLRGGVGGQLLLTYNGYDRVHLGAGVRGVRGGPVRLIVNTLLTFGSGR